MKKAAPEYGVAFFICNNGNDPNTEFEPIVGIGGALPYIVHGGIGDVRNGRGC